MEKKMAKAEGDAKNTLYCSFCGKSQHEVRKLIAGPTVFICDECVELCMDIIREENKSSLVKSRDGRSDYTNSGWNFQMTTGSLSVANHSITATAIGSSGSAQLQGSKTVAITSS